MKIKLVVTAVILMAFAGFLVGCASQQTGSSMKTGASPQIYGTPGSPSATTTISGKQLPPPDPKFGGVIKDDALQSKPWWAPRIVPPKSAPNVLLIITDDAGFGVPSTFGGVIPTPTMDRIAKRGSALQPHLLHRAVLADARRADHRAQPPLGRLRRDLGAVDRLPRLQQHHRPRTRPPSAASCSTTATPRRGSARTTTRRPSPPARSGPSTSGRPAWASSTSTASSAATPTSGSRTCSATPPRSIRSRASRAGT